MIRRHMGAAGLGLATMAFAFATAGAAPPVGVHIPTVVAPPGAVTSIQIELDQDLIGLGVYSIDYRLALNPAVISAASFLNDGLVLTWGTPFSNIQPTLVAVSAGGIVPVTSNSRRIHSLAVTVASGCPVGDYPLTLSLVRFNGGDPAATVTHGVLQVRSGVDAPLEPGGALALGAAAPNPARGATRIAFRLPADAALPASLDIHALDGRRVRTLASGRLGAGVHERTWDLRDASGRPVAPGVYFARLVQGTVHVQRRIAVVR